MTRYQFRASRVRWLLVLSVIGYPIAGLVASLLDLASLTAAMPLRLVVLVLSLSLLKPLRQPGKPRAQMPTPLILFGLFYLVRLCWDGFVAGVPGAIEALVFFVFTVLLPAYALLLNAHYLDELDISSTMFRLGSALCLVIVAMTIFQVGQSRAMTDEAGGRVSFEALNPISIGHLAATALISAVCLMAIHKRPAVIVPSVAAGVCGAMAAIGWAASRGPVLSLVVAGLLLLLVKRRASWVLVICLLALPLLLSGESELLTRFSGIDEDDSALERLVLQASAIEQFLARPLFGSAFVEPLLLSYPHNLFIEVAMAMGMIGLVLLGMTLWRTARGMRFEFRQGRLLLPLLFTQYFVAAQFSGSLYSSASLWAVVGLLAMKAPISRSTKRRPKPTPPIEQPVS